MWKYDPCAAMLRRPWRRRPELPMFEDGSTLSKYKIPREPTPQVVPHNPLQQAVTCDRHFLPHATTKPRMVGWGMQIWSCYRNRVALLLAAESQISLRTTFLSYFCSNFFFPCVCMCLETHIGIGLVRFSAVLPQAKDTKTNTFESSVFDVN